MTEPIPVILSDLDKEKLATGNYVVDAVFGVQPKSPLFGTDLEIVNGIVEVIPEAPSPYAAPVTEPPVA